MKKLLVILTVCVMLVATAVPVFAAGGQVTYDGKAREFIFAPGSEYSPTDLFPNFKDVMPGDTLTQDITVKNDAAKNVKVKIYMRSLGAHEDSAEFLSQLRLQVQKSADNQMAYMFDAAANETAGLTDWVELGTLYSGGEVNLDVTLQVPVELDNTFKNEVGYLDWEFRVEEFPIEDSDPKPPQTGDSFDPTVWIIVAVCALVVMLILFLWSRNKKKKDTD